MEERKLIQFGKSAFCMTMPQAWLRKNHLKKGDSLSVQETLRNSLEIMPAGGNTEDAHELDIDISGKSTDEIIQLLLSTYLNGYTVITLRGPNAGKVAFVRKHVHEFIAAEIMEVTSNKMVIHIFWDINNIHLQSIINRVGHITRSVFAETIELIDSGTNAVGA
jgi:phosphate uptake regulator